MNSNEDDIQQLKQQIETLNLQIESVAVIKNDAELSAKKYGQELEHLRAKLHTMTQQLLRLESTDSCNMWENIGDGG